MIENYLNKITNGDCVSVMSEMPDSEIDLIVTSPPYNVNIPYDVCVDNKSMDEYWEWTEKWLSQAFRLMKDDGRIAINVPYEVNVQERGGRVFFISELYQVMKKVGFNFFGIVDLEEDSPHRSKTTAWGSWMSASGPYIYNPKECVILAYKKHRIKQTKGVSEWEGVLVENDGIMKMTYSEEQKKEFLQLVYGQWKYNADTRSLTKATFSSDIPAKAIKILSYRGDVIMDPFSGSGTTCLTAERLGRKWIGIELSENYSKISENRIGNEISQTLSSF